MLLRVEDEIHCWLLTDRDYAPFRAAMIADDLNRIMPEASFDVLEESEGANMVLSDQRRETYVLISLVQEKADSEILARSLSSSYAIALSPGIEAAIESHRSYVHITVSSNHPVEHVTARLLDSIAPDLRQSMEPLQTEFEAVLIERKIVVCQWIARLLTEMLPVVAVYWGQSDLVMNPDRLVAYDPEDFPSLIHVHPFLYSEETAEAGRDVAFTTLGARYIIGREIDFRPCRADFPWMFESTLAFLRMARINNHNAIPDGDSFGRDEDEVIRVRYLPPEPGFVPLIALEVERSMEHGIELG
jgi:hypothetical protein